MTDLTPERTYTNPDGATEEWWSTQRHEFRGVEIATTIKTMRRTDGDVTAQDVALLISDHTSPRTIGIPTAVLDQVIDALQAAKHDAERVSRQVTPGSDHR